MNYTTDILPLTQDLADTLAPELAQCFNVSESVSKSGILNNKLVAIFRKDNTILTFCTLDRIDMPGQSGSAPLIILEIWNVCTPAGERKKGYASRMIKDIIEYAKQQKAKLWLCVDDERNINLYTKLGFINPAIVSTTATGRDIGRFTVELIYDESAFADDISEAQKTAKELLKFISVHTGTRKVTKVEISPHALEQIYSKNDMYYMLDDLKGNWLIDEDVEYGGQLYFDGKMFEIKNISKGQAATVSVSCSFPFAFHTHPLAAYKQEAIGINPISHTDLIRELYCMSQMHVVFAMEGMYVYQVTPEVHAFLKLLNLYPKEFENFIKCFRKEIDKHVIAVYADYQKFWTWLQELKTSRAERMKLYEKQFAKRTGKIPKKYADFFKATELDIVNNMLYSGRARQYIQTLIKSYRSITLEDVFQHDKRSKLEYFCKKFFKDVKYRKIEIFYVNFIENVQGRLKRNTPIYIEYV